MKLGAFSVSLTVSNLVKSQDFYQKLDFEVFDGDLEKNYLIMKNGETLIGLFHGMFDKNILTFNPGWDTEANRLDEFDDVRDIQRAFKDRGIQFEIEAEEDSQGPASFVVVDPDGNPILVDQHVERPTRDS